MKPHFIVSSRAQEYWQDTQGPRYHYCLDQADYIVVLGGDGTLLQAVHTYHTLGKPFYGVHLGRRGIFMNPVIDWKQLCHSPPALTQKLPLIQAVVEDIHQEIHTFYAVNEVVLRRHQGQAAHIHVTFPFASPQVLEGDGLIFASPMGSFAYNRSAGGPLLTLNSNCFVCTPLGPYTPFPPRVFPQDTPVTCTVLHPLVRPVMLERDGQAMVKVKTVTLKHQDSITLGYSQNKKSPWSHI